MDTLTKITRNLAKGYDLLTALQQTAQTRHLAAFERYASQETSHEILVVSRSKVLGSY